MYEVLHALCALVIRRSCAGSHCRLTPAARSRAAESVAVAADGALWTADRYGAVRRAARVLDGRYVLQEAPIAHLGPGRPLGFEFDAAGDLIVCVAGAVRSPALLQTLPSPCPTWSQRAGPALAACCIHPEWTHPAVSRCGAASLSMLV